MMAQPGIIGGATGLEMERWSLGIAATWFLILPPLWLLRMDGGVWFCRREDFETVGGYDESVPVSEDVRLLWALRKLGRRRRPRQRLTRGRSTGPPAKALASARKFDRHGDWHFLRDTLRLLYWMVVSPRKFDAHVQRYWYEDER